MTLVIAFSYFLTCCKKEQPTPILPEITTKDAEIFIEDGVAYCSTGGNIVSNGGSDILSSGVCWSTHELPTILDLKYTTGIPTVLEKYPEVAVIGNFSCSFSVGERLTTYYIRAFATNIVGTAYGNQVSITTPCYWWMQKFHITGYYPKDGVVVSSTNLTLNWLSIYIFGSVKTLYDIYLDTNPDPTTKIASNLSSERFTIPELNPGTTYYWKIYGWETAFPCNNVTSEIFSFNTRP
jgi:hypothetical protein